MLSGLWWPVCIQERRFRAIAMEIPGESSLVKLIEFFALIAKLIVLRLSFALAVQDMSSARAQPVQITRCSQQFLRLAIRR